MKIKIDEALSGSLAVFLRSSGYEVATVREQGWGGLKDPVLWPLLLAEKVFFITADKEFGDIRKFPPGTHHGILLLRPDNESVPEFTALLASVLKKHRLETLASSVVVANPRGVRVRSR